MAVKYRIVGRKVSDMKGSEAVQLCITGGERRELSDFGIGLYRPWMTVYCVLQVCLAHVMHGWTASPLSASILFCEMLIFQEMNSTFAPLLIKKCLFCPRGNKILIKIGGMGNKCQVLYIVVPCYNEEEVLHETVERLSDVVRTLQQTGKINNGRILFVDDGSRDGTWQLVEEFARKYDCVEGLKLAHNVGHQQALWAGLEHTLPKGGDAVVSIDADLQDDITCIYEMVEYFNKGIDIVYGIRRERKTDTFFKKTSAQLFYRLMRNLGGEIIYNHADFRLMSRRTVEALMEYPERNLFLRGMVCSLGYPSAMVYYDRRKRFAGESKYPFSKMLSFAVDGITSFSVRPLRYIVILGLLFIFISILAIIYGIYSYLRGDTIPGWTSLLISIWFIGGMVTTSIGIIGEYVGKIYKEVKRRPKYFVEKEV